MPSTLIRSPGRTTTRSPDGDLFGRDLDLGVAPDHARGPRIEVEQLADGALGSLERERFQALADQGDEDDLGGDEILAQASRRDAGDRQGDVGADRSFEQGGQGEIDHAPAADHRGRQGQRHAERPLPRAAEGRQHHVRQQQQPDHGRHRPEPPPLGIGIMIVIVRRFVRGDDARAHGRRDHGAETALPDASGPADIPGASACPPSITRGP